jgi:Xaa-Pro aminopeptidase
MTDQRSARIARVRELLPDNNIDAFLVTGRANVQYLTGFSGSSGLLLVTPGELVLFTDFRYDTQVKEQVGDLARVRIDSVSLWHSLWDELAALPRLTTIGFESSNLVHRDFEQFLNEEEGGRWQWRPQEPLIEELRASKDAGEVALIEQAAGVATRALTRALEQVRPGLTELQVAGILEHALRDEGSEAYPFESIVASGPRAALPHATASHRKVQAGDFLLLDFGATVGGYCSDVTRTVVVGHATNEQRTIYEIVRAANEIALRDIRIGMTGKHADSIARDYITAQGFGDDFGHSLGHGIGLEIHEAPRLSRTAESELPPDTVVTIEPGIYRAGWGGVRIEDDVYLSAAGPRVLTDFTHDLLELSA